MEVALLSSAEADLSAVLVSAAAPGLVLTLMLVVAAGVRRVLYLQKRTNTRMMIRRTARPPSPCGRKVQMVEGGGASGKKEGS